MKKFLIILLVVISFLTLGLIVSKPSMHKQLSFSVVDYLIKFNNDGSMTTQKTITTTKLQKEDR